MTIKAFANSQLRINNVIWGYVPNTLDYDLGLGEQVTKAVAGGGGTSSTVHQANVESNISCVKFELYTTGQLLIAQIAWKTLFELNQIILTNEDESSILFPNMALDNRVTNATGAEKTTPIEFYGDIAIVKPGKL